jgi:hypothetical protein
VPLQVTAFALVLMEDASASWARIPMHRITCINKSSLGRCLTWRLKPGPCHFVSWTCSYRARLHHTSHMFKSRGLLYERDIAVYQCLNILTCHYTTRFDSSQRVSDPGYYAYRPKASLHRTVCAYKTPKKSIKPYTSLLMVKVSASMNGCH